MLLRLKKSKLLKYVRKRTWYSRLRQNLPMPRPRILDDSEAMAKTEAERITLSWPADLPKPRIGIVKDYEPFPRWTKYVRFLETNAFDYGFYDLQAHDWLEQAHRYDVIVGILSSELFDLQEMREKYHFLETYLGKTTYPSAAHALLYEDKKLEAYVAKAHNIPFVKTHISYNLEDALRLVDCLPYPLVSKIVPASGSYGVNLVRTPQAARRIVRQVFSTNGRKTHVNYFRQKNHIYFQEYLPNDGYDLRVIVVGHWAFGYYRKALPGDFRASGMGQEEKRALPGEAMQLAMRLNHVVKSPLLVVDMLRSLDGQYHIIEFSPTCQMELPETLKVDGESGVYIFTDPDHYHFEKGKFWLQELALREFLQNHYLPTRRAGQSSPSR